MNQQNNNKWLDELISKSINTEKPQFDVEMWKQKFPDEFNTIQSRAARSTAHPDRGKAILKSSAVKFAAAAVLMVTIGLFIFLLSPDRKAENIDTTVFAKSPADMASVLSLNIAFRQGGMEAVDKQSEKAIEMLGPRPAEITIQQILSEFNGT